MFHAYWMGSTRQGDVPCLLDGVNTTGGWSMPVKGSTRQGDVPCLLDGVNMMTGDVPYLHWGQHNRGMFRAYWMGSTRQGVFHAYWMGSTRQGDVPCLLDGVNTTGVCSMPTGWGQHDRVVFHAWGQHERGMFHTYWMGST
ncbi:hypothetical protein ACOMHN_056281 [Nucella lapillus]